MNNTKIGFVLSSSSSQITVKVPSLSDFENNKEHLQVGRYLQVSEGNEDFVICVITALRGTHSQGEAAQDLWEFEIDCQPLGTLISGNTFKRGATFLPVPTEPAYIVSDEVLASIFAPGARYSYALAPLAMNSAINLMVDPNGFFGKHMAIVGSTGSGKSCTVARLLQDVVGLTEGTNAHNGAQKNSHVIIFDYHSEYEAAFRLQADQQFTLNCLNVDSIKLPYWLMNAEELEALFIESNEANSHNQVSQFKHAVIENKKIHNPSASNITYDSPVYFSIAEVLIYITNLNKEVIGKTGTDANRPKLQDGTLIDKADKNARYFEKELDFAESSQSKETKANGGPFFGEFNRFISRMQTTLADERLRFLLDARNANGEPLKTEEFGDIIRQYLGYIEKANISIVDLSGIPFEVMSITVSLVTRLVFDFCYQYSKLRRVHEEENNIPFLLVYEEAHNYVPNNDAAAFKASRKAIERVAKEGRKYGLSLVVVSQRPSEVSSTICAQCSNFVALRLTNNEDQAYVRHLLPNNTAAITGSLPILGQGEAIIVGDSIVMPAIVQLAKPKPEPHSADIPVHSRWSDLWCDVEFAPVVQKWQKISDA